LVFNIHALSIVEMTLLSTLGTLYSKMFNEVSETQYLILLGFFKTVYEILKTNTFKPLIGIFRVDG